MTLSARIVRLFALPIVAGMLASCGGETTTPTPIAGTLSVAISPESATVQAGSSASAELVVTRGGSFTGAVTLTIDGAPSGVVVSLGSATLGTGATTSSVTIAVDSSVAAGTYPLSVRANGTGLGLATTAFTLTVTALPDPDPDPDPDFAVELSQTSFTIQEGDSVVTPVIIRRTGGFTGNVGLFVTGAPTNVAARVTPNSTADTIASLGIAVAVGVPPGTYPLVLTASESGPRTRTVNLTLTVTPKPSAGVLTLTPSSISLVQTVPSSPVVVRLVRPPGVTGPAELSLQVFLNGSTATFTPNPMTGDSSLLVINTTLLSASGTVTGVVRATVGNSTSTAELVISTRNFVPPDFGLSVVPTAGSVTAGNSTSAAVTIARSNLADEVSFTVSGAPVGMTASVTPSPTTADSATLDITTTTAVAPGVYPLTISGSAAGIAGTRTATFSLTVNAPNAGGNVQWQFCDPARTPLWFATRAGTTGAWTPVASTPSGAGVSFGFPFAQAGQVAYVLPSGSGFAVNVHHVTPQEIVALAAAECANNRATRTMNGTVVNLINTLRGASVVGGGASTIVPNGGSAFTLTGVREGPIDVLAYQGVLTPAGFTSFDRIILRRDLDPVDGATLPPFDFDFNTTEWLFAAGANQTFLGFGTDSFTIARSYLTSNGNTGVYQFGGPSLTSPRSVWAVPTALRRPGNLHQLVATTVNPVAPRSIIAYEEGLSSFPLTFGPLLDPPTVTVLSSAPVQLRAAASWQPEYQLSAALAFTQGSGAAARSVSLTGSAAFFGAAGGYSFDVPDFTGAAGWNPTWMLQAGTSTSYVVTATGLAQGATPTPADDVVLISGSRVGTVTP